MFKPDFSVKTYAEGKINSGMIDVNKLPEFPGFTLLDAETGKPINNGAIRYYALSSDGELFDDGWGRMEDSDGQFCRRVNLLYCLKQEKCIDGNTKPRLHEESREDDYGLEDN